MSEGEDVSMHYSILAIISALRAIVNPFVLHNGWAGIQAVSAGSK